VKLGDGVATVVTSIIGCAVMTGCGADAQLGQVRAASPVAVFAPAGRPLHHQAAASAGAYR
jgi:Zn-dependent alcohol dehydrogenase